MDYDLPQMNFLQVLFYAFIGVALVEELCKWIMVRFIAYNHKAKEIAGVELVDLETLFKESDFISLHLKTIPDKTEGIITKDLLKLCKRTCFIENQGDHKLVNNEDLIWALENNAISGYGATLSEKTKDLKNFDNVILSPANAWFSDESLSNLKHIWMNNIIEYDKGNIINLVEE